VPEGWAQQGPYTHIWDISKTSPTTRLDKNLICKNVGKLPIDVFVWARLFIILYNFFSWQAVFPTPYLKKTFMIENIFLLSIVWHVFINSKVLGSGQFIVVMFCVEANFSEDM